MSNLSLGPKFHAYAPRTEPVRRLSQVGNTSSTTSTQKVQKSQLAVPVTRPRSTSLTRIQVSDPSFRDQELSVFDKTTRVRKGSELQRLQPGTTSQKVRNGANLIRVMDDPTFGKVLKRFSPGLGQRLMQAFGRSKGSVDGGRFKKTMMKMLPIVNIGAFGRDTVRAQKMKKALGGIADHAKKHNNDLALQLANSLRNHQTSKRNSQMISGVVSVGTTAVAFIPGTQLAPTLANASSTLATSLGGSFLSSHGINYTGAMAVDSGIRTLGGMGVQLSGDYTQDYFVNKPDRVGTRVGKTKVGSGYSKLKVSTRMDGDQVKMETEMGYQAARALVNYLGPGQQPGEPDDSPRLELRRSLGATDDSKTYVPSPDKKEHRKEMQHLSSDSQDYLQLFFDIGVKGSGLTL